MNDFDIQLGKSLRQKREEVGLTQAELSARSGVSRVTINQIENGRQSPRIETFATICAALGTGIDELVPQIQDATVESGLQRFFQLAVEGVP